MGERIGNPDLVGCWNGLKLYVYLRRWGGLGLGKMKIMNLALLAKLAWRILINRTPLLYDSSCKSMVNRRLGVRHSCKVKLKHLKEGRYLGRSEPSLWWNLLENWEWGWGENWVRPLDSWGPDLVPRNKPIYQNMLSFAMEHLVNIIHSRRNAHKINQIFHPHDDASSILLLPPPVRNQPDQLTWIGNNFIHNQNRAWWRIKLSYCFLILGLRIGMDLLPTKYIPISRKIMVNSKCLCCGYQMENLVHLLENCLFTRPLWLWYSPIWF